MTRLLHRLVFALALTLAVVPYAFAQDPDDAALRPAEPDFTLVSLPTSLRLPVHGSAFHMTHRFNMPLNHNTAGEVFGRLFGIDSSAFVGLEYRFGLARNLQIGIHHSTDNRTTSVFGQYGIVRQSEQVPVDVSAFLAVDIPRVPAAAPNTFERQASPAAALIVSRTFMERAALYVEPVVVSNMYNRLTATNGEESFVLGVGGRLRILPTVTLVAEVAPRVAGFTGNTTHAAFGIEKRAGGHLFQLDLSNSFGSLLSQIAQGGPPANDWHLGFNLTRKFF